MPPVHWRKEYIHGSFLVSIVPASDVWLFSYLDDLIRKELFSYIKGKTQKIISDENLFHTYNWLHTKHFRQTSYSEKYLQNYKLPWWFKLRKRCNKIWFSEKIECWTVSYRFLMNIMRNILSQDIAEHRDYTS